MNVVIQTPTPDILKSKTFYTKMGFTQITNSNAFTDGKSIIEINPERFARPGIKLIAESWSNEVEVLNSITKVIKTDTGYLLGEKETLPDGRYVFFIIYLYVSKKYRNNKIGSELLRRLHNYLLLGKYSREN